MKPPARIASLLASATEILYLVGAGDRVVAVSHECDFPADAATKPRVTRSTIDAALASRAIDEQVQAHSADGGALYELDVSRLEQLAPDLIVTQSQCDVCAVRYEDVRQAVLSRPALKQAELISLNPASLSDVLRDVRELGRLVGRSEQAAEAVSNLQARIGRIAQQNEPLAPADRPRVACIEWLDPPMLAGNWMPELIEMAGGQSPVTRDGGHSRYAEWSDIAAYDPDEIILAPCGFDVERTLAEWADIVDRVDVWPQLRAVRSGCAFAVDGSAYFNRSGPRLVDSLELLAGLIHPQRFPLPPHLKTGHAWRRLNCMAKS